MKKSIFMAKMLFTCVFIQVLVTVGFSQDISKNIKGRVSPSYINILDFGAKITGTEDNSDVIRDAINALPDAGGSIYFPTGTYLINSTIVVNKPVHFSGEGVQRYSDRKGYDYEAGTKLITKSHVGISIFRCSIKGSKSSSFQGITFEGIGFKDESTRGTINTLIEIRMINNFRIFNCSFFRAKKAIAVDAGSEDASWGEIQNCIFAFNDTGIDNRTSQGSVPNLHVTGGMFVVGSNQCGLVNHKGQYVRLNGFKMDILGDSATGIIWAGGTKGSITDIGIELNENGPNTHGIIITPQAHRQQMILDVTLLSLNITSDGTCGAMIKIEGKTRTYPVTGIKIIGGGFSGGTTGIALGPFTVNNLISGCSFRGFNTSSISIDTNSHHNLLTDVMSDRPSADLGGIRDLSTSTVYNGYHWVDGGDNGSNGVRPAGMTITERNKLKHPKTGELIFNTSNNVYEFYDGTKWLSFSYPLFNLMNSNKIVHTKQNIMIGNSRPIVESALLTLNSRTQGLLPPRMSKGEKLAIKDPPEGLIVYDLDLHKLSVFNGKKWE